MMFVPFTGIDNHNRNVTLGAAILGSETAETYSWLLRAIKNAYGYAPPVIVTDQDPAMKRAIADVWPESRHRLCMWHIMDKLTTKVWFLYGRVLFFLFVLFLLCFNFFFLSFTIQCAILGWGRLMFKYRFQEKIVCSCLD